MSFRATGARRILLAGAVLLLAACAASAPALSWPRVQQLAVCAMVLDAIVNDRDYEFLERELIADWRVHYARACMKMKDTALQALRRVLEHDRPADPAAAAELETLVSRLAGG